MRLSVQNMNLSQKHVNSSVMNSFRPHNGVILCLAVGRTEVVKAVAFAWKWVHPNTVAESFDVSRSVAAWLRRSYQETDEFTRREGRPISHDVKYGRSISFKYSATTRRLETEFQHAIGQRISKRIKHNRLHDGDQSARRQARWYIFTRHNYVRREFAKEHQKWRLQDWRTFLFMDKSRFHLSACNRCVRVFWDDLETDTRTTKLWKQTDIELWKQTDRYRGGRWWYGMEFLIKAERTCTW